MPVGDLMGEWFENEPLKALLAGPGVSGTMLGPRSAGSSMVLLLREASRLRSGGKSIRARGGPGAVTQAMAQAAREAGAEIRTGVTVERIIVSDDRVTGVVANGQTMSCGMVLSGLDPRTTFLSLIDPVAPGAGVHDQGPQLSRIGHGGEGKPGARVAARVSRGCRPDVARRSNSHRTRPRLSRAGV